MADSLDPVVALAKRRGFVFPSSEIYGGLQATYDYGPLGVELKRLLKEDWWRTVVRGREDVVGLDASIFMAGRVWEVSGHVEGFHDTLVDCKTCKARFRVDKMDDAVCPKKKGKKPGECGGELTEPRQFNTMFKTQMGAVQDATSTVYLRPETAQGIFVNFKNVLETTRVKIPFGIGQIGKAFRNEIVTGGHLFRMREFEQMELEFFCEPGTDDEWWLYWKEQRLAWWHSLGIRPTHLRIRDQGVDERAHYAKACGDIEYLYPWGWDEVEGVANRTDYDLKRHQEGSRKGLAYRDEAKKEWIVPYVIEPSAGVDRCFLTLLCDAFEEQVKPNGEKRVVLHLHPKLAPTQVGIYPLVRKDGMPEKAHAIFDVLKTTFRAFYDESGTVGKRYSRQDEAGTPFGITVDSDTLTDGSVTVRDRDSMEQVRVPAEGLTAFLADRIATWTLPEEAD